MALLIVLPFLAAITRLFGADPSASVLSTAGASIFFNIPVGLAEKSLRVFSQQSGKEVVFSSDLVKGVRTNAVKGTMPAHDALSAMLVNTGLMVFRDSKTDAFSVRKEVPSERKSGRETAVDGSAATLTQSNTDTTPASDNRNLTTLSPFVVSTGKDQGYRSEQSLIGSRTAKDLMDMAGSVSIINKEMIDDLNAAQVSQVLEFGTAGVTQNTNINDDVNIRGFRTQNSLRDGVTHTGNKQSPMFDVERIEVIKGPAAMLLGNNSYLGGAVNFVSIKPTSRPEGSLQLSFAEHGYVRFVGNVMGPLLRKSNLRVDYRVTLGGIMSSDPREIETEDKKFVGAALAMYFGDRTTVTVNGHYSQDHSYAYYEDFLDYNSTLGTQAKPLVGKINQYSTRSFSPGRSKNTLFEDQNTFIDVNLITRLTDNTFLRLFYYGEIVEDRRQHIRGIRILPDNRTLVRQFLPQMVDDEVNNIQGDLNHKFAFPYVAIDTTVGFDRASKFHTTGSAVLNMPNLDTANIDWSADDAYFVGALAGKDGLPKLHTNPTSYLDTSFSYYIQENLSFLNNRIVLVGGVRWFQPGGINTTYNTGVITNRPDTEIDTHKYGIVLRPIKEISLYYSDSSNAFSQTGGTDRFQRGDNLGPRLGIQQGKAIEYGLKVERQFTPAFSAYGSLVHFDMELTNVRTEGLLPEANPPGSIGLIQSEADRSQGWELQYGGNYRMDSGTLNFIGTYFDAESQTAANPAITANNFVPRSTSLMVKYARTSGPLKGFMLGGTYYRQATKQQSNYQLEWPSTKNIFMRYAWGKHWSVQLNLNNVTDERYLIAVAGTGLAMTNPGFASVLSVRYKW